MQISRRVLLACGAACCLFATTADAADTEAQIKARQALEQRMREMQAQPAPTQTQPAQPAQPAQPTRPTQPAQSVQPTQPTVTPPAAVPPTVQQPGSRTMPVLTGPAPSKPEEIDRAREALRKALMQPVEQPAPTVVQPAQPPVTQPPVQPTPPVRTIPPTVAQPTQPVQPMQPAPTVVQPAPPVAATERPWTEPAQFAPVPPPSDPQKALEALRQKLQEPQVTAAPGREEPAMQVEQPERPARQETASRPERAPRRGVLQYEPLKGPPTGLSPEKEQRLHELTQRYFADELTPEQYHAERAKILAP